MGLDTQFWFIVFVCATAISVTIQLILLAALCYIVWRFHAKVKEIERKAQSQCSVLQEYGNTIRELLALFTRTVNNAAEITERMKGLVGEAAEVSQKQVGRADHVIDNILTRLEKISESLEADVAEPFREARAFTAALRTALGVFLGRHKTNSPGGRVAKSNFPMWFILAPPIFYCFTTVLDARQAEEDASYEGQRVAVVGLLASPRVDAEALRPLVMQKEAEPYSAEKVHRTIAALQETGKFNKVEVEVTPEAAGLRVIFVMQPVYYLGLIYFPGALKRSVIPGFSRLLITQFKNHTMLFE